MFICPQPADVIFLADIFENYGDVPATYYGLDPVYSDHYPTLFYTVPNLAYDANYLC